MKAAVVIPPVRDFYHTPQRFAGLGARAVESVLTASGWESAFFNFPQQKFRGMTLPLPAELGHLREHLIAGESGPTSFFSRFAHFGPSFEEAARMIRDSSPDIVFISCFAYCYAAETLETAAAVKRLLPRVPVAAGGSGVTVFPAYFSAHPAVDFAFSGDAEASLPSFLREFQKIEPDYTAVSGLHTADVLNSTPAAPLTEDRSPPFLFSETGRSRERVFISTSLSRGCPEKCRFCSNHLSHGRKIRTVPLTALQKGLRGFPRDRRLVLNLEDDNLLLKREYFFKALSLVKAAFPDAEFTAENGLDLSGLDEATVRALIGFGFRHFNLSLGSADDSILRRESRHDRKNRLERVLSVLEESGTPSVTYFICGLAGDTPESTVRNLLYLAKLPTRIGISLFYPVPGIPGFEDGKIFTPHTPRRCAGTSAWPWTASLSTAQMITAFRLARFLNALKGLRSAGRERKGSASAPAGQDRAIRELLERIQLEERLYTLVKTDGRTEIREVPSTDRKMLNIFFSSWKSTIVRETP